MFGVEFLEGGGSLLKDSTMRPTYLAAMLSVLPLFAEAAPVTIDVTKLPKATQVVDEVVVPIPSEVFAALDKLGKPKWGESVRPVKGLMVPGGGREQVALVLGTVIADGFVAVQAESVEEVKQVGSLVRQLAKAIGVERAVTRHATAIVEAADRRAWNEVKRELDGAIKDVRVAMTELNNGALSQLVSVGGWLRGTEVLAAVVGKQYSADGAELLQQPLLADHFAVRLTELEKGARTPLIGVVRTGLSRINEVMGTGDTRLAQEHVRQIGRISGELVLQITERSK